MDRDIMIESTEQTVRQYAKISEIPLKKVLDDLKKLGFSSDADDVIDQNMRQKLSKLFRQRHNLKIKAAEINQTIWQFAKASEVSLEQVLEDLKSLGFSCNADDMLNQNIHQDLSKLFRQRLIAATKAIDAPAEAKAEEFAIIGRTLRQYAKIYDIPVTQVLEDLKKYSLYSVLPEFQGNVDDVLDQKRHAQLAAVFCKWLTSKSEAKALAKVKTKLEVEAWRAESEAAIALEKVVAKKEAEALTYAASKASKCIDELKKIGQLKIGQLMDLCFELVPENISVSLSQATNNQVMSDIYIQNYYEYLKAHFFTQTYRGYTSKALINKIDFPEWTIMDYELKTNIDFFEGDIYSLNQKINELKKQKCYTAALIKIIHFLINFHLVPSTYFIESPTNNYKILDLQIFSFIGELLIEMGAIDSALKLYGIDERIFNNPNRLSLLASNAVRIGNLESSTKLIAKLLEQEPYHPSVPIIKAEIKRLEQRHRLKATLSIDFSKVDELSGLAFENLLLDKFVVMGFKVESTPKTGDFGADLIVENNEGTRIIVQCKRFKSKVNLKAVQEVVGAMGYYAGDLGIVITNNSFLNSAVKLAESHDIELWDGDKLVSFLAGDLSFSQVFS
jgi:HJR/Mrr/RecB family endonuclease